MSAFEIGDRVEFTAVKPDTSYPGDHAQYEGQVGTVIEADDADETAYWAALFGADTAIVGVLWDSPWMRNAMPGPGDDEYDNRACFELNLRLKEGN